MRSSTCAALTALLITTAPASAAELFAGVAAHAVDTPFSLKSDSAGTDLTFGIRGAPVDSLGFLGRPAPYLLGVLNLDGETSLAAAGLSWKFGQKWYVRPGIGLAVHDGPSQRTDVRGNDTNLGSRILFEPEIAIGVEFSNRVAAEASWIHVSHATLFNVDQNPGLDIIGARLVISLN